MDFPALVRVIQQIHEYCERQTKRAVNTSLTLRNWAIGAYIAEYEQGGADRAAYATRLFERLSRELKHSISGIGYHPRELRRCREFYLAYPGIGGTLSPEFEHLLPVAIRGTLSPESHIPPERLLNSLSFSHFVELISMQDPLKRAFYEIECIRGNWSVRALKRQISALYFERSGLSKDKDKLAEMVQQGVETEEPQMAIRDPYIFEFLGLRPEDAVAETNLETALVANLRDFLLEMGHGFCLEAQQKSIIIGNTRGFVDLVFYHRILKCHVLVDLKVAAFNHENIGQLNTYVSWYRKNMMREGDGPPIGLLLCTGKDHALVEYAMAAIDNRLFVSKYQLELPDKEKLAQFIEQQHRQFIDVEE